MVGVAHFRPIVDRALYCWFVGFVVTQSIGFAWDCWLYVSHTHTHTHTQLVSNYGVDKNLLPSRGVLGFFSQPKKSELVEMQKTLEHFLMTVVKNCPVAPTELFKFLGYPFSVSENCV